MSLQPLVEAECEPTVESVREPERVHGPVTVLSEIKHKPNQDVVDMLERMLEFARSGELLGFVVFGCHVGGDTVECQAGKTNFGEILTCFEDWKFKRAWRRTRTDEP